MIALILAHPHAFWLSLGGLLLAAEMMGTSGYLLWSGVAAVITGLLVWLLPLGWEWQGVCFAVLTVVSAWLWWRWLSRRHRDSTGAPNLNQRGNQLIGQVLVLETALVNGHGNIRVGDSSWPVSAAQDLPAGCRVRVIAIEGITLRIQALPAQQ
ncbi:NfeD family protein [Shimwellia pseudoproteus]|uniref:NfeD family protein n=1 Tax=Shimwellia pseudoproteus TaxID=570012 RepID=UPI0018EDB7BC|nr:NfeD family protein [Shimwellia pseudoproteus]MBJ3814614.1 NfeD family protein [Shimwellia pseudoproteus]